MKRRGAVILVLALAAACGGRQRSDIVWWTPSWGEARARTLAARFEAAHPGAHVALEITVADGLPARIQTALRSGSPPDVIEAQHGWVVPYAQANLLLPMDDVLHNRADYLPAALDYLTWNKTLWGLPFRVDTHAILFNRGMFRDAGLDPERPPETWPEFAAAAERLTKTRPDGRRQYGFAITGGGEVGNTLFRSLPFLWMNGGGILGHDGRTVVVNSPESVEALTFYTDMFTRRHVSPASTIQDDGLADRRLFMAGSVAMYQSGPFDLPPIRQENPDIDLGVMMIPHPRGKTTAVVLGGWSFIVPRDATHPAEAKALVEFLSDANNMAYFTDTFPARLSSMALPRFADPLFATYKKMLPFARPVPQHRNWLQIVQVYFEHVQRVLVGDATPQMAMDDAAREIRTLVE
jgi:multiple sugar transport system substrate-binding protein